ncbi:MAG: 3-hydroxyacyl-CoA dehydrogenase NAD-binding domain-containing protein [Chloroflexota bacterium]|nr:3-hydroxyacyl-CoA dehydrogenase NAD-binding domain-containing protein [Chloroflexota bacterium]
MSDAIAVIGSGTMGAGIAQVAATTGFDVILVDRSPELAEAGRTRIESQLNRQVAKGKLTQDDAAGTLARIAPTVGYDRLADVTVVIEAVFEDLDTKRDVIQAVGAATQPGTLFATNTSSISITRLASYHPRPAEFAGLHFFNPVPVLPLVELIQAEQTASSTLDRLESLATRLGKTPVRVSDSPGFVVNRVLIPMINEAILCLEAGVATREAIDATMKLGASHPMGPLELADMIGLDVVLSIMDVLHRDFGDDKYRASVLLRRLVAAGKLGRKSGEGFYVHS